MKIYLVVAEHYAVPGRIMKAFSTKARAERECVELVNIMLEDMKLPHADSKNWEGCLKLVQDMHDDDNCYVDIIDMDVDADTAPELTADVPDYQRPLLRR